MAGTRHALAAEHHSHPHRVAQRERRSQRGVLATAHYVGMAKHVLSYLNENDHLLRLLMGAGVQARLLIDAFTSACVEDVVQRIENSPRSREKLRGISPVLAAEYYVGGMIAAAKWWYTHNKPCTEEELIQHLCALVEEKKIL